MSNEPREPYLHDFHSTNHELLHSPCTKCRSRTSDPCNLPWRISESAKHSASELMADCQGLRIEVACKIIYIYIYRVFQKPKKDNVLYFWLTYLEYSWVSKENSATKCLQDADAWRDLHACGTGPNIVKWFKWTNFGSIFIWNAHHWQTVLPHHSCHNFWDELPLMYHPSIAQVAESHVQSPWPRSTSRLFTVTSPWHQPMARVVPIGISPGECVVVPSAFTSFVSYLAEASRHARVIWFDKASYSAILFKVGSIV